MKMDTINSSSQEALKCINKIYHKDFWPSKFSPKLGTKFSLFILKRLGAFTAKNSLSLTTSRKRRSTQRWTQLVRKKYSSRIRLYRRLIGTILGNLKCILIWIKKRFVKDAKSSLLWAQQMRAFSWIWSTKMKQTSILTEAKLFSVAIWKWFSTRRILKCS